MCNQTLNTLCLITKFQLPLPEKKFVNLFQMEKNKIITPTLNSKGASIFKKMLEDKRAIHQHLKKGGNLSELKNKYRFVKPLPTSGKR